MVTNPGVSHIHEFQPTDLQVIDIVRNGDVDAFVVLVDRYHGPLARHLTYRLGDPELGADIAQETFLDAFRHLDRFDGERSFSAWLYGIGNKCLLMHVRRQRMRRLISLDWLMGSGQTLPSAMQLADGSESSLERDILARVLAELSPPLRDALLLHSVDGFTAPEIAGILRISRSAAERRVSRAKEQFRKRYRELNDGDFARD